MLKFGWSKKSIGTTDPVGITGQFHERISKGILDEVSVTALAIDDGESVSILMSGDLVNISDGVIFDIRDAVRAKNCEIPVERILFSATHTHTSPRYMRQYELDYERAPHDRVAYTSPECYRRYFVSVVSDAVVEAYENRKEGSFSYGYGYAVVGHHRRPTYFGESGEIERAVMYGKTNDPAFAGYEGNVDSTAYFMFTFDADDHLTGAVINVPCPSQNSEMEDLLSADYWAEVRELVKKKYGDIYILPQAACAGDLAPRILHAKAAEKRKQALKYGSPEFAGISRPHEILNRREIAERIMVAFDDTLAWASKEKIRDIRLSHTVKAVRLEARKVTEQEYREAVVKAEECRAKPFVRTEDSYEDFKSNTKQASILAWHEGVIERYRENREFYEPEIHVLTLGDQVAFVSVPFELYLSYQHRIQARSPFVQTFLAQLGAKTEVAGYLCTENAERLGGYSASVYSCLVSPRGGDTLVEEAVKELNKLYSY